ncbi:hypothetical protein, partial [uncultured Bifidobacterium sp.]|uniref:hypothetical protein n=1 Tax=uncultured Bifidobacterium sp. TaxID=165187 RepID=UPI00262D2C1F
PTTQPPPHKPYKTHANTGVSKTPHTTHQNTQTNQPNTKTTPKTRRVAPNNPPQTDITAWYS